jgi:cyclopropane-fatty-acyl-phospholipid synthase
MAEARIRPDPITAPPGGPPPAAATAVASKPRTARSARLPLAARVVLGRLARLREGHLVIRLPDGSSRTFAGAAGGATPVMELEVHRWRFFSRLLRRGDIGAGDAWVDGD